MEIVVQLAIIALIVAVALLAQRSRKAARRASVERVLGADWARLQSHPALLEPLRGRYREIVVWISSEEVSHGRHGSATQTVYSSMVVLADGTVVDLERGVEDVAVEENARWLAAELDVPFDLSYG